MSVGLRVSLRIGLVAFCFMFFLSVAKAAGEQERPQQLVLKGIEFVLIPEGWFWYTVETGARFNTLPVGAPEYKNVRIWLDAFYMAKYEAAAKDLVGFLNSAQIKPELKQAYLDSWSRRTNYTGCTVQQDNHGRFIVSDQDLGGAGLPATHLTWNLARAFALWMGFDLPTEAQWQKAARGVDQRIWPWGDTYPDDSYALFGVSSKCSPEALNRYPRGASPYGLFNMGGNVQEFVLDWFNESFEASLQTGMLNPPIATKGTPGPFSPAKKILKGGGWSRGVDNLAIGHRVLQTTEKVRSRNGLRFAIGVDAALSALRQGGINEK